MDVLKAAEGKNVVIYGAHLTALELYRYLENGLENFRFEGFAVTSMEGNPEELEGKKVRKLDEYCSGASKLLFLAMPQKYHEEAEIYARQHGFYNIYPVAQEKMEKLKSDWILVQAEDATGTLYHVYEDEYDKSWLNIAEKNQCGEPPEMRTHFKFPTLFYKKWDYVADEIKQIDLQNKYERIFGVYRNLHGAECQDNNNNRDIWDIVKIYMAFSRWDNGRQNGCEKDSWIIPIQAGSVLTEDKAGTLLDETGDNISGANRMLAEMTVAYWIWKNEQCAEYKGLCHYRRHFVINEDEIRNLYRNHADVILTTPRFAPGGVGNMFLAETPVKQFVYGSMVKSVGELYPEEEEGFLHFLDGEFYYPNNMVIAKCGIYNGYCEWIFPTLCRMRKRDSEYRYGHETDRHLAYAAELLTSYYFVKHKEDYKIMVTDYRFVQ